MNTMTLEKLGIEGPNDPYHFKKGLNRITIEASDDYRLVLFFIKKGTVMPLHDHPNMCVFFRLMFGKLDYKSYDKLDEKFKYNRFSLDEYQEILGSKKTISAKLVNKTVLHGPQFLMVRPSRNNLHAFVAEENTSFFDICLPNYTTDSLRRITYFKEVCPTIQESMDAAELADNTSQMSTTKPKGLTYLTYDTTPPKLPVNFEIEEVPYRGELI